MAATGTPRKTRSMIHRALAFRNLFERIPAPERRGASGRGERRGRVTVVEREFVLERVGRKGGPLVESRAGHITGVLGGEGCRESAGSLGWSVKMTRGAGAVSGAVRADAREKGTISSSPCHFAPIAVVLPCLDGTERDPVTWNVRATHVRPFVPLAHWTRVGVAFRAACAPLGTWFDCVVRGKQAR